LALLAITCRASVGLRLSLLIYATQWLQNTVKQRALRCPSMMLQAGYAYPPQVRFELAEKDIASYRRAADFLNINSVDIVCLQHEYGIFGGLAGSHILALLRDLNMPVVTTLHTILESPDTHQLRVLQRSRCTIGPSSGHERTRD
jgi:hypothetical protein